MPAQTYSDERAHIARQKLEIWGLSVAFLQSSETEGFHKKRWQVSSFGSVTL